jgi:hypothetical protein
VTREIAFEAELWEHPGEGGWHFVTLPPELAEDVREQTAGVARGFGSLRVTARVGGTRWQTSVFPSTADRSYLLPVKRQVRRAEGLLAGDLVDVRLELLDL